MSKTYDDVDLSLAFNRGHEDGFNQRQPKQPPHGVMSDQKHQRYREGYEKGHTAGYWYRKGQENANV